MGQGPCEADGADDLNWNGAPVRDGGALETAPFRPQTGYYRDVIEEAAAMFESLVHNHPFVDGNKRAAFAATDVFLRMNGIVLDIDDIEAYEFIVGSLEQGRLDFERIDRWLRQQIDDGGTDGR